MRVRTRPVGFANAAQAIVDLERRAGRKAVKQGVNDATKIVLAAAKAGVPVDTAALKKSLGRKVVSRETAAIGVVGARKDAKGRPAKFRRTVRRRHRGKDEVVDPAKYVFLVERGTRPHAVGKGDSLTRGKKAQSGKSHPGTQGSYFMTRAWVATEAAARAAVVARVGAAVASFRVAPVRGF